MKRWRDIQTLCIFFALTFFAGVLSLIYFFQNHPLVQMALAAMSIAATWLTVRSLLTLRGHVYAFQQRETRLTLLASRDPATGLFQQNGFETLLNKEIERAKRCDYTLTLLLMQIEPFQNILHDIGVPAMDRLLFQVGETLQNASRSYDNVFKIDAKTFAVFFSETDQAALEKILERLKRRIEKTSYLVNTDRVKVTPVFKIGAALYPMDGTNAQSLEAFARTHLSATFDLRQIHHPQNAPGEFFEIMPTVKSLESQPTANAKEPLPQADQVLAETNPDYAHIDPQTLQGTPEMNAFQDELKLLFARTDDIEKSVQKLLQDETHPAALAPKAKPKTEDAKPKPTFSTKLKPLTFEPLPAGLSYFQPTKEPTIAPDALPASATAAPTTEKTNSDLPASVVTDVAHFNPQHTEENAWSIDDIASMPDVVAALMQNEIHQEAANAHAPATAIQRKVAPAKVQKIEVVQNGSEPIIQVDFQK